MSRRERPVGVPLDPAVVAAVAAALAAAGAGARPLAVREVTPGGESLVWRRQGRQDNMRGGWPW